MATIHHAWPFPVVFACIDPQGRHTGKASSDHYFRTWCLYFRPSVRPYVRPHFSKWLKQKNLPVRIVIATVGTVGLAEWIIDDTHVLYAVLFTA